MMLKDRPEFASKLKPLTFRAQDTVADAVAKMSEKGFGSVVIVDSDDKVTGIVTERDVMKKLVNMGRDAKTTALSDIMTADPRAAKETDDVVDWLRIMSNERFRRLPVVDVSGGAVGQSQCAEELASLADWWRYCALFDCYGARCWHDVIQSC